MNSGSSSRIPHSSRFFRVHRTTTWQTLAALFLFCITPLCLSAQNLVPNPSFEILTTPGVYPSDENQVSRAAGWETPTAGTSDFYYRRAGGTCATKVNVPLNMVGTQNPWGSPPGNGYGGIITSIDNPTPESIIPGMPPILSQYREYLAVKLNPDPSSGKGLVQGRTYNVSFHASLAELSNAATTQIGVAFFTADEYSTAGYSSGNRYFRINQNPAEITPAFESAVCLNDRDNWQLVQGTYTARGGEEYMVIGCFRRIAFGCTLSTPYANLCGSGSAGPGYIYHYIDEVSVEAANSNAECNVCDAIQVYTNIRNNSNPCCWEVNYALPEWIKYQPACNLNSNPITSVRVVSPSGETVSLTPSGAWTTSGNNFNHTGSVPYTNPTQQSVVMGTVCLNTSNSSTPKSLTFEFRRADGSLFCTKPLIALNCAQACENCPIDFQFTKVANIAGGKANSITGCCFEYGFTLKKKPAPECSIMGYRITRIGTGSFDLTFDPAAFPVSSYGGPAHPVMFHNPIPAGAVYTMGTMCFSGFGTSPDGKERIKIELLDANQETICEKYYEFECSCCDGLILEPEAPISPTDRCCWDVRFNPAAGSYEQSCLANSVYDVVITELTGNVDVTINSPAPGTPFDLSQSLAKICIDAEDAPLNTELSIILKGQQGEILCSKTVSKLNCESCCKYLQVEAKYRGGSSSSSPTWPCPWEIKVRMPDIGCNIYGVRLVNMTTPEPLAITETLPLQSTPIDLSSWTVAGHVGLYGVSSIPAAATVKVQLLGPNGEVLCERLISVTCGSTPSDQKMGTGESPENSSMLFVLPNPSMDGTTVHYTVQQEAHTELALYDASGTLVSILYAANKPAGNYALSVQTNTLPSGTYYIKMRNGNQVFTTQLVVVH